MNLAKLSQAELLARCAWCHQIIPDVHERFGNGMQVRPERRAEIIPHEGRAVPLLLATGRELIAMVVTSDSQARAAGYDLYVQTCSEECSRQIEAAAREEIAWP